MKHLYIVGVILLLRAAGSVASEEEKTDCGEKEKALALLETAEDLLSKAKAFYPTCKEASNESECGAEKKSLAYIEISRKLISEAKDNFPSCPKVKPKEQPAKDCTEILKKGQNTSGVYSIWLKGNFPISKRVEVFCDMDTEGGGWTVIQRRGNFTPQQDFYKSWKEFKVGFGDIKRDFWLGNDNIYALSNQGPVEIRIDLEDSRGNRRHAVYKNFRLEDEEHKYTLRISGYSGNAGDGMSNHSGKVFSTKDDGQTGAVAALKGAWWMNEWAHSHLNGLYLPGQDSPKAIHWYEWLKNEGLAFTEMKVRLN